MNDVVRMVMGTYVRRIGECDDGDWVVEYLKRLRLRNTEVCRYQVRYFRLI